MHDPPPATRAAFAAALLFTLRFVCFFLPPSLARGVADGTLPGALLAVAEHALLFPVIAALPAPTWARAAGWGWLVLDMTTDIMALHGVPPATYLAVRYGGHLAAALWVLGAAWPARGRSAGPACSTRSTWAAIRSWPPPGSRLPSSCRRPCCCPSGWCWSGAPWLPTRSRLAVRRWKGANG